MELAVNIPEHDPQVGHAPFSRASTSASGTLLSAPLISTSIKSYTLPSTSPASIGPPETKIAGMFRRMAAISIPGVILSQFDTQIIASARWAFTMYSTLSAMRSREGSE